jgi:hypothetical protein
MKVHDRNPIALATFISREQLLEAINLDDEACTRWANEVMSSTNFLFQDF